MLSKFEDAFGRHSSRAFRETLLQHLDGERGLWQLRRVSPLFHRLIYQHRSQHMFRELYVDAPLPSAADTESLARVAPRCRHLTIKVGYADRPSPSGTILVNAILDLYKDHQSHAGNLPLRNVPSSSRQGTRLAPSSPTSTSYGQLSPMNEHKDQQLWSRILHYFPRLEALTLRVDGDPFWPGRTEVEDMLITLRIAIENSNKHKLRKLCLAPIHAMGIIHLRWLSMGAFGNANATGTDVWRTITTLDMRIQNPFVLDRLTESQAVMFRKCLYDYLRSFAPTLHVLRLVWLGGDGPGPLTLHLCAGLEQRSALQWPRLEELWIGCIVLPRREIQLASEHASNVTQFMVLRSTRRDSSMDAHDSSAWIDVTELWRMDQDDEADDASSVYSQSSTRSEVSRTSRDLEILLDFEVEGAVRGDDSCEY